MVRVPCYGMYNLAALISNEFNTVVKEAQHPKISFSSQVEVRARR